jgi:hypothetical protein
MKAGNGFHRKEMGLKWGAFHYCKNPNPLMELSQLHLALERVSWDVYHCGILPVAYHRPQQHNSRVRRDKYTWKSPHTTYGTQTKHTDTSEHNNSSLKTGGQPHEVSTTIYTTQPIIRKHQGSPATPFISVIRKLNVYFNLDKQLYMNFVRLLYNSLIQF